jgi:hypothetical protein
MTYATAALPVTLRSEAFTEDILDLIEVAEVRTERPLLWLVGLTPLAVALVGVAFALVPPLA